MTIKNRQADSNYQQISRGFSDFEDLQESARDWDLDFRQMDRGRFDGALQLVLMRDVRLAHVRLDRRLEQAGAPPPGLRTIAVPAHPGVRLFWRGRQVSGNQMLVYPRGSEIDAISLPGFEMYVLSFSPDVLDVAAHAAGVPSAERLLDAADAVSVDPVHLDALRQQLALWFSSRPSPAWAQRDLPVAILRLLAGTTQTQGAGTLIMDGAIRMARERVAAQPYSALRVSELCEHIGVSERTLRHAFRERLGMTPKAYIRDRRLNLVRGALQQVEAKTTGVAELANRWDFWHMGQFAADYRRLFGELPSETTAVHRL